MDGFYVCKIQKLSDKIKTESEESQGGEEGSKSIENENPVDDGAKSKAKEKVKVKSPSKFKMGKKSKRSSKEEELPKKKKPKTEKVSVPPPVSKSTTKKKVSAKMTKPRRMKAEKMM